MRQEMENPLIDEFSERKLSLGGGGGWGVGGRYMILHYCRSGAQSYPALECRQFSLAPQEFEHIPVILTLGPFNFHIFIGIVWEWADSFLECR
jgi:hypothetical protein